MKQKNRAHWPRRRSLLVALAALGTAGSLGAPRAFAAAPGAAAPGAAAPRPVVVLTSYQDELVSRFEAAFEKSHPQYRLQVIWRNSHDGAAYLRQPGQGGVDVYWAPSPRTFAALAREDAWRPLTLERAGLPQQVGNTPLLGAGERYIATEMAGFGFAVSRPALARLGAPAPGDWRDLADPRLAGQIALPVPAVVDFAPPIVEIVLQAYGWQQGWALWSEIVANAVLVDNGATAISDLVASGRCAIGVSINFFVTSAIANGAAIDFVYPRHTGVNPAHAAITRSSGNPDGARTFVAFLLSAEGQGVLAHPDLRRLPVRPSVYRGLPAAYFNPFAAAANGQIDFNAEAARPRLGLSSALFQQMLVLPQAEIIVLWQRIRAGAAAGKAVSAARDLLVTVPLTEAEAADETLRRRFGSRVENSPAQSLSDVEAGWQRACRVQRDAVRRLLDAAGA